MRNLPMTPFTGSNKRRWLQRVSLGLGSNNVFARNLVVNKVSVEEMDVSMCKTSFTVNRDDAAKTLHVDIAQDASLDIVCCDPRGAAQHTHSGTNTRYHVNMPDRTYCVDSRALTHISMVLLRTHGGCGLGDLFDHVSRFSGILSDMYIEPDIYAKLCADLQHTEEEEVYLPSAIRGAVAAATIFWTCANDVELYGGGGGGGGGGGTDADVQRTFMRLTQTLSEPALLCGEDVSVGNLRAYYVDGKNASALWQHVEAERVISCLIGHLFSGRVDVDEWRTLATQQPCLMEVPSVFTFELVTQLCAMDGMSALAGRLPRIVNSIQTSCADCVVHLFKHTAWFMVEADVNTVMKPFAPLCKVILAPSAVGQAFLCASASAIETWQRIHAIVAGTVDDADFIFDYMADVLTTTDVGAREEKNSAFAKHAVLLRIHDSIVCNTAPSSGELAHLCVDTHTHTHTHTHTQAHRHTHTQAHRHTRSLACSLYRFLQTTLDAFGDGCKSCAFAILLLLRCTLREW
jgi:hypothetical protein